MSNPRTLSLCLIATLTLAACGDSGGGINENNNNNGSGVCDLGIDQIQVGDPDGHTDPLGAMAAGEARASRVSDADWIVQPAHGRQKIRLGDFLLINSRIAVYIESSGLSDGYARFGGDIIAVDAVGQDGRPKGLSNYGETLMGLAAEMIRPESITVIADGSDGGAAVVRVKGTYEQLPFLRDLVGAALGTEVEMPGYYDYVLEPDSPRVTIRLGLMNTSDEYMDLQRFELYGFFHYNRNQMATERKGFDRPSGGVDWVAFNSGAFNFAWRSPNAPVAFGIEQSGLQLFIGGGLLVPPCTFHEWDHAEIIGGGPHYDGLREVIREVDGEAPWRAIDGVVQDSAGTPLADAWVHELDADGGYLSRSRTDAAGAFTIHAPPEETVTLVPQIRGYPTSPGVEVDTGTDSVTLPFAAHGVIHVTATDASTLAPIPVRIQVIPTVEPEATPDSYGVLDEVRGRLHQHFSTTGDATLMVPPGEHRIIVSRGYEYELHDVTVQVDTSAVTEIVAPLSRSVDTTDYLCADFHVHTHFSADSNDPVEHKIRSQVADGLDLPVFSDHEWVTAPDPLVQSLGLGGMARGITSLELTTFLWGHFGILPLEPRPDELNNGAPDWIDRSPAEVFDIVHDLPEQPLIIVNHPRTSQAGGYFNAADYDPETGEGNELWSDDFDLMEAFNGSSFDSNRDGSVADWFSFLEFGRNMVVVGSSDSHHVRTQPTGYPRTCLYFGHDDPSAVAPHLLREALLEGDAFVSGGIYVNVEGPGGERIGDSFTTGDATVAFTVTVQTTSWIQAQELEVIVNGVTTETLPLGADLEPGPGRRYELVIPVDVDAARTRNWVVFHARGAGKLEPLHPSRNAYGITNAIYFSSTN